METDVAELWDTLVGLIATYGLSVLGAVLTLIVGLWFARFASRQVRRLMERSGRVDPMLTGFVANLTRYAIVIFTVIAVLARFGVETTSLIAVLGAAGLALGLALQGTLANFAAGVMLLIFRPFKVGHYVDAGGIAGTVREVNLFSTELDTPDNIHLTVPNGQIWGQPIRNFSHNPTRRLDIACGIAYDHDIDNALGVMMEVAGKDSRIHADPAPATFVDSFGDNSVNLLLRVWCRTDDFWQLKWDLTKAVKQAFDDAGIEIPFPQRTLHIRGRMPG